VSNDEYIRKQELLQRMSVEALWDAHIHYVMGSDEEILRRLAARDSEIKALREALEDMVGQFAYETGRLGEITTGGLSALEHAFSVLGWDDPHVLDAALGVKEAKKNI
jgi:hypothetical protein